MTDFIERKAALSAQNKSMNLSELRERLERIPAADVRPVVRGQWIGAGDGYADGEIVLDMWECGCCGKLFDEWDEKPTWRFCPECGAELT